MEPLRYFLFIILLYSITIFSNEIKIDDYKLQDNPFSLIDIANGTERILTPIFYKKIQEIQSLPILDFGKFLKEIKPQLFHLSSDQYCHAIYCIIHEVERREDFEKFTNIHSLFEMSCLAIFINTDSICRLDEQIHIFEFVVDNYENKCVLGVFIDRLKFINSKFQKIAIKYNRLVKDQKNDIVMNPLKGFDLSMAKKGNFLDNDKYKSYFYYLKRRQIYNIYFLRIQSIKSYEIEINKIINRLTVLYEKSWPTQK